MPETMDQSLKFKNKIKLHSSRLDVVQFLELYLSKFSVLIWSSKCGIEGKNLFVKFLGQNKKRIDKRISILWFVDDGKKYNDGKNIETWIYCGRIIKLNFIRIPQQWSL